MSTCFEPVLKKFSCFPDHSLRRREVDTLFNGGLIVIIRHRIDADFGRRHLHDRSSFAETLSIARLASSSARSLTMATSRYSQLKTWCGVRQQGWRRRGGVWRGLLVGAPVEATGSYRQNAPCQSSATVCAAQQHSVCRCYLSDP
jgi:hypothetical protein